MVLLTNALTHGETDLIIVSRLKKYKEKKMKIFLLLKNINFNVRKEKEELFFLLLLEETLVKEKISKVN